MVSFDLLGRSPVPAAVTGLHHESAALLLATTQHPHALSVFGGGAPSLRHQLTGNAGMYHVARELSRRGWHVMPTVRNARGADLYAASADESRVLPIQSKALSKRSPVPLGGSLDVLRSKWWIISINANTDAPTCFVLTLAEVKEAAHRGQNAAGKVSYWLQPGGYDQPEYREAWHRLGEPQPVAEPSR